MDDMLLRAGDVLFNNTNSVELVGKTAYFPGHNEDVTFSNHITRLRVNENLLCPQFLAYWLQLQWRSKVFEGICDRWIGQAAVQRRKIEVFQIPKLLLERQQALANGLSLQLAEVENARNAAESQVQDAALLRTRLLEGIFAQCAAGEKKTLGDFATTSSGSTPSRAIKHYWQPAEIPWVKTGEVSFSTIRATEESISRTALAECSLMLLPPRTVLVAMYGQGKTRGQSAILDIEATTNQACFAILPNDTWEPEFLYYWLMVSYQKLRNLSENRGGNQANLNGALLNELKIPAPDQTEQLHIVEQVKAALFEIDALEQQSKATLVDIEQLPNRILARAYEN